MTTGHRPSSAARPGGDVPDSESSTWEAGAAAATSKCAIPLLPWLDGIKKGRCEVAGEECVQYSFSVESPSEVKYLVKDLTRQYEAEFWCRVSVRGRKAFRAQQDGADEGKLLRASLYPLPTFWGRRARLRALAAAEKEFDAVIQSFVGVAASTDVVTYS